MFKFKNSRILTLIEILASGNDVSSCTENPHATRKHIAGALVLCSMIFGDISTSTACSFRIRALCNRFQNSAWASFAGNSPEWKQMDFTYADVCMALDILEKEELVSIGPSEVSVSGAGYLNYVQAKDKLAEFLEGKAAFAAA